MAQAKLEASTISYSAPQCEAVREVEGGHHQLMSINACEKLEGWQFAFKAGALSYDPDQCLRRNASGNSYWACSARWPGMWLGFDSVLIIGILLSIGDKVEGGRHASGSSHWACSAEWHIS